MNRLPNPSILQCNYCSHEWERQGHVNVSDRRHVISHDSGDAA